jgi:ligand-binding SRPBCC domain-containing protein
MTFVLAIGMLAYTCRLTKQCLGLRENQMYFLIGDVDTYVGLICVVMALTPFAVFAAMFWEEYATTKGMTSDNKHEYYLTKLHGPINSMMICQHCHNLGNVRTKPHPKNSQRTIARCCACDNSYEF